MNATAAKTPAAPQRKAPAKSAAPAKAKATPPAKAASRSPARKAAPAAEAKPAKIKLVRDSFTMPSDEYASLAQLKQRALAGAHPVKKSELLRAGIKLLAGLGDAALLRALKNVPAIKTGRPKTKKGD